MSNQLLDFSRDSSLGKYVQTKPTILPKQTEVLNYLPPVRLRRTLLGEYDLFNDVLNPKVQKFKIPRYGLMESLFIEIDFTLLNAGRLVNNIPAAQVFQRIELRSKDRVIATVYPNQVIEFAKDLSEIGGGVEQTSVLHMRRNNIVWPPDVISKLIMPLPFAVCGRSDYFLDTRWVEDLELHWFPWNIEGAGDVLDRVSDSNFSKFNMRFYAQFMTDHKKKTFPRFLGYGTKLLWDVFDEKRFDFTITNTLNVIQPFEMSISCPYPIWKMTFMLESSLSRTNHTSFTHQEVLRKLDFDTIEILDGNNILQSFSGMQLRLEMSSRGTSFTSADAATTVHTGFSDMSGLYLLTVYFNENNSNRQNPIVRKDYTQSQDGYDLAGFFVPSMFSNPRVRFNMLSTFPGISTLNWSIYTVMYYHKFMSVDPKTGRITNEIKL